MVFSSLIFLLAFLPLNLILYFTTKSVRLRNAILLVFSLVFYAWGEPVYVLILLGMSFFSWVFSLGVEKAGDNKGLRRLWLTLAVIVCVGAIGFFKYAGFLATNLNALFGRALLPVPHVSLPIGISFYTFQLLTYVVDVYRGEVPAQRSYFRVLLYAGLFHQCVAGPIVRYGDIEKELTDRVVTLHDLSSGANRFVVGLAKKSLLANACGAVVDTLLLPDAAIGAAALESLTLLEGRSALTLWVGMAFYMLQIYLDFSAYSDMAIGMGKVCGFHYKENFDYPYISASVTEFWRRWHMSLGTFFRDYVYIPLGGNRTGKARQVLNLFVVWALTGLWHGANWNFIFWGLYFFLFLVLEKFLYGNVLKKVPWLGRIYTLVVVYFGWVFFKFSDLGLLGTVLRGMFCANGNPGATFEIRSFAVKYILFFVICVFACTPLVKKLGEKWEAAGRRNALARVTGNVAGVVLPVALFVLSVLSLVGDSYNPFLYFQF